ncbi:MAG: preprotein translocase subunit SecY [Lentisphaeria bacterium]|nr:preprotein translocase subunit SecY [Lentisphaeria bacterium]
MLSAYLNCFKIPELKKRLLFTFAMIALVELTGAIPCPGIDPARLKELFGALNNDAGTSGMMGTLALFSGGAMEKFAIGALGIMPYISASIILQLMTPVIPALNKMVREGESGMQQYNFIMRVLTVAVAIVQGIMFSAAMMNPGRLGLGDGSVVMNPGIGFMVETIIILTGGSMFITWLGEMITERGVGNGASLIITVNIIARIPSALASLYQMVFVGSATGESQLTIVHLLILVVLFVAVTVGAIMLTEGMRKIPVRYAQQRSVGGFGRSAGVQTTYLPLRVNYANVMPIIFAGAILGFIDMVLRYLPAKPFVQWLAIHLQYGSFGYLLIYAALLMVFAFFWVANQFNPIQIADDFQKNNGYIPGIRPGKATSDFLDHAMTRITLGGAIGLLVLALLPMVLANSFLKIPHSIASFFGGTSLLIIVGVMLDTMRQIQTYLISRNYDGFLSKGILRNGRRY